MFVLECFLIKATKRLYSTKLSIQHTLQELHLLLELIYQMKSPLKQAGLSQPWAIHLKCKMQPYSHYNVVQTGREKYLLRRREIIALL